MFKELKEFAKKLDCTVKGTYKGSDTKQSGTLINSKGKQCYWYEINKSKMSILPISKSNWVEGNLYLTDNCYKLMYNAGNYKVYQVHGYYLCLVIGNYSIWSFRT